jgi:peroxiredoxin
MNKIKILIFIVYHLLIQKSFAQIPITQRTQIETVIDKATGKIIPKETVSKMIQQNPRLNLQGVINEYGEISHHIYYGDETPPDMMDTSLRVKIGEPFRPFIMRTLNNETIYSSKLLGKIVVLDFWLRITKKTPLSKFDDFISESQSNKDIVPIIVCQSSEKDAREFVDSSNIKIPIVANAYNFHKRYQIIQVPTFIVIDKEGKLVGYFTSPADMKKALISLKNK